MRSCDLIRSSFRWLLLAIKDVVFRVSFVCFGGVLGSLGSRVLRRFVYEGLVTSLARFCVQGREKRRSLVSMGWRLVCLLQTPVMVDNEQAGMLDMASAPPAAEEEIGGRSPLQTLEQAGPAESLGRYRIPLKRPLQHSDRADSSSHSNSDSDSDGESGPSAGRQVGLVGIDGYRRFDPLAKENDNSWQLPEDLAAYWEAQVSARLDSAARKAIKEVAPAPVEAGLSPAKIDPDILSLLDEGARDPPKQRTKHWCPFTRHWRQWWGRWASYGNSWIVWGWAHQQTPRRWRYACWGRLYGRQSTGGACCDWPISWAISSRRRSSWRTLRTCQWQVVSCLGRNSWRVGWIGFV